MAEIVATYSIAACDLDAGQWGVATQSKFLAVGSVVPWAVPGVGAVATQAYANPRYGPQGLQLLAAGLSAAEVVARLTDADDGRATARWASSTPRAAAPPTPAPTAWTGPAASRGPASPRRGTSSWARRRWPPSRRRSPPPRDARWPSACSSALPPRRRPAATGAASSLRRSSWWSRTAATQASATRSSTCVWTTTRSPSRSSRRLYAIHSLLFGKTPREQWLDVGDELRAELTERLGRLGYDGELQRAFGDWSGTENLEERVDGVDRIDPVVLEELRRR